MSFFFSCSANAFMIGLARLPRLVVRQRLDEVVGVLAGEDRVVGRRPAWRRRRRGSAQATPPLTPFSAICLAVGRIAARVRVARTAPGEVGEDQRSHLCPADVVGREIGDVLVRQARGDAAHRRMAALPGLVGVQRVRNDRSSTARRASARGRRRDTRSCSPECRGSPRTSRSSCAPPSGRPRERLLRERGKRRPPAIPAMRIDRCLFRIRLWGVGRTGRL